MTSIFFDGFPFFLRLGPAPAAARATSPDADAPVPPLVHISEPEGSGSA